MVDKNNMCMLMCMCMLTKRAQILFDEDLWKYLVELAKAKSLSVGELIRNAVEAKYAHAKEKRLEKRREAIESTLKHRIISKEKINYKELINYGRKY